MRKFQWKKYIGGFAGVFFLFLILLFPQQSIAGISRGLACCAKQVIPALFPFFIVSSLIIASPLARWLGLLLWPITRFVFGIKSPRAATALLISWLGGFAVAASTISELYKQGEVNRREAQILLVSGVGSGPAFVINTVGLLMLGNAQLGVCLYASLLCANVCGGFVLRFCLGGADPAFEPKQTTGGGQPVSFVEAVQKAAHSMLLVCGFVVFFQFLCSALFAVAPFSGTVRFFISAILEVTAGCSAAAALGAKWGFVACCFALSVQSLSVLLQVRALLCSELSILPLFAVRPLHLMFSFVWVRLWVRFLPQTATAVLSSLNGQLIVQNRTQLDTAFILFLLCCVVLSTSTFTSKKQSSIIRQKKEV